MFSGYDSDDAVVNDNADDPDDVEPVQTVNSVSESDNNTTANRHKPKRVVVKKGRSVVRNFEGWQKSIAKAKRNRGEDYVSYASKKQRVGLKKIGAQCKDGCFEKVGMEKVQSILDSFWAIGDYNKQNAYISGCISEAGFKSKYTKK